MLCRVIFFPQYAPEWFWTVLSVTLAVTGALVIYCTALRAGRFKYLKDAKKKLALSGSIIFHLGLVLIIVAGFYYTLFQYKALLYITEGQTLTDSLSNYAVLSQGPVKSTDFDGVSLTLLDVGVDFYDPKLVEHLTAQVEIDDLRTGKISRIETAMNRPFNYQSRKAAIYKFGFAPLVVIKSPEGEILWQGFVNLDLVGGKADLFAWPLSGQRVRVDATMDSDFKLTYFLSDESGEAIVLKPGDPPSKFMGCWLQIPEDRYWLGFVVTSVKGRHLILAGLFLSMIGILLRYLFVFKDSDHRVAG